MLNHMPCRKAGYDLNLTQNLRVYRPLLKLHYQSRLIELELDKKLGERA